MTPTIPVSTDSKTPDFQIIDIEFKYPNHPYWYRAHVSIKEYGAVMNSGLLHGKTIEAVKLWTATEEDMGTSALIYSFLKSKAGIPGFEVSNDA